MKKSSPLVLIYSIFFLSGFSALIYQISWQRILTIYYGVGSISIALIVSVFMLGLGLGGFFGGVVSDKYKNLVKIYFFIEFILSVFGLLSLPFLDFIGTLSMGFNYSFTAVSIFIFLCIPTFLMGATLPLLVKISNKINGEYSKNVSFLYFVNSFGAALGALFTPYILISFFGLNGAVFFASLINLSLSIIVLKKLSYLDIDNKKFKLSDFKNKFNFSTNQILIYCICFITGFIAIGYEILWIKITDVIGKSTAYIFPTVLFIYLMGLSIGSFSAKNFFFKTSNLNFNSFKVFLFLQGLLAFYVFFTIVCFEYSDKFFFLNELLSFLTKLNFYPQYFNPFEIITPDSTFNRFKYLAENYGLILIGIFLISIPSFIMGLSFPLISYSAWKNPSRDGSSIGYVYFFTIIGNVLGGIITTFLMIPSFGLSNSFLIFIMVGALLGLASFNFKKNIKNHRIPQLILTSLMVFLIYICYFYYNKLDLYRNIIPKTNNNFSLKFQEEGIEGIVTTYFDPINLHLRNFIGGLSHGGLEGGKPECKYSQTALEGLTFSKNLNNALIIGYGTGGYYKTLNDSEIKTIDLVELNDTLMRNLKKIKLQKEWLSSNKLNYFHDDGRRFLKRTNKKYDIVMIDALRATTAYSNNLYSSDFYSLIRKHLKAGGVFVALLPEGTIDAKTLADNFEFVRRYNFFAIASNENLSKKRNFKLVDFKDTISSDCFNKFKNKETINYLGDSNYIYEQSKGWPRNSDYSPHGEYYFFNKFLYDKKIRTTSLHLAVIRKNYEWLNEILKTDIDINKKDGFGWTPLHRAAATNNLAAVKILIKHNAIINPEDNEGWTPLHRAVDMNNFEVMKFLIKNNARNKPNKNNLTPLDFAIRNQNEAMIEELKKIN